MSNFSLLLLYRAVKGQEKIISVFMLGSKELILIKLTASSLSWPIVLIILEVNAKILMLVLSCFYLLSSGAIDL